MKDYLTKQRKNLIDFFKSHSDTQFSIEILEKEIAEISKSAIYRNINKLVDEGIIRRFQKEGYRKFFYQYVGNAECNNHLHLKCLCCGSIYHMNGDSSKTLMDLVYNTALFELNIKKTMLFGQCDACEANYG